MSRVEASSGADLIAGEHENVKATEDGLVELTSKNLFPNASLNKFEGDGLLSEWGDLGGPLLRRGWHVYARLAGIGPFSRQNTGMLPLSRAAYSQYSLLSITGSPAPDETWRITGVDSPEKSELRSVLRSESGFAPGYYGVCFAWCVFSTEYPDRRLTGLGPRRVANIPDTGPRQMTVALPPTRPEGPVGLAILSTGPQVDVEAAQTAPVYLQRVVPTDDGYPSSYVLEGPWRKGEVGVSSNLSFVGGYEVYDEPDWEFAPVADLDTVPVEIQLSWSFRTVFGRSASQKIAPGASTPSLEWIQLEDREGVALRARPPLKPPGALDWRLEWRGQGANATGNWYTYVQNNPDEQGGDFEDAAFVFTADETGAFLAREDYALEAIDRSFVDNTGIRTPDLSPPSITQQAVPIVFPSGANIEVVTTWELEDGTQTGPSPVMTLNGLTAADTFRVYLPPGGNRLSNPEFELFDRSGIQDWYASSTTGVDFEFGEGAATCVDSSGVTTGEEVLYNQHVFEIDPLDTWTVRLNLLVFDLATGRVRVLVRQLTAAGANNGDQELANLTTDSVIEREVSFGPVGSGADYILDADTRGLRIVVKNDVGPTGAEARDFSWTLSYAGIFEGLAAPSKLYTPAGLGPVTDAGIVRSYPVGGYLAVVESPPDAEKPAFLAGQDVNMLEYYGPPGTQPSDFLLPEGLRIPVRPGQTYTLSAGMEGIGLPEEDALTGIPQIFLMDWKDEDGVSLGDLPPLAILYGYSPWQRYAATVTAPAQDVGYLEIIGSRSVGEGRIRVAGIQFEKGVDVTAFSDEIADMGYFIVEFDTHMLESDTGDVLNRVREITGADVVSTLRDPDAGTVTPEFASSSDGTTFTSYVGDVADMPVQRYVNVKITLTVEIV